MPHSHEAAPSHHEASPPSREIRIGTDIKSTLTVESPDGQLVQFFSYGDGSEGRGSAQYDARIKLIALEEPEKLLHPKATDGYPQAKARLIELGWDFDNPWAQAVPAGTPRPEHPSGFSDTGTKDQPADKQPIEPEVKNPGNAHPEPQPHYEEPERMPIVVPARPNRYTKVNQKTFTTTHQDFLGRWYQVENSSREEAKERLISEELRNKKLKTANRAKSFSKPLSNGLYRLNVHGNPVRPVKSSQSFVDTIAAADAGDVTGNYDMGGATNQRITNGTTENGSNEMAAIKERSVSIVMSERARDEALREGRSLEEAQKIGTTAYEEQERFRFFNDKKGASGWQREVESVIPPYRQEHSPATRNFLRKIGHSIIVGAKVMAAMGVKEIGHYGRHKISDSFGDTIVGAGFLGGGYVREQARLEAEEYKTLREAYKEKTYREKNKEKNKEKAQKAEARKALRLAKQEAKTKKRSEYQREVNEKIKKMKRDLAKRHPNDPRYTNPS